MAANPFDQFDAPAANPFDQFDAAPTTAKKPAARPQPKAFSAEDLKKVPQTFTAGVLQGLGSMGATLLAPFDYLVPEEYGGRPNRRAEITNALAEMYQPSSTGVSGFAGGLGNVLPIVAGTAGLSAPAAVAQRGLGGAIATGGLSRTVANLPTRVVGGGIGGATAAGYVNPEDMATGAAIGAALPVLGGAAGQGVRKLTEAYNALGPNAAQSRVGEMLRQAAGSRLGATQAAQAAQPNQLASLASAEASTPAYQAMMRIGQQLDPEGTSYFANQATKQAERAALGGAAGGRTQTEALATRKAMKEDLTARTTPQREEAIRLSDRYRVEGRPLEEAAAEASTAAKLAVEDVRRFSAASERAQGRQYAEDFLPEGSTYPGQLSDRADALVTQRAGESLAAGETARELEARLASMKAAGLQPLRPDSVINVIKRQMATAEGRFNEDANRVLKKVLGMLEQAKTKHGDIRAEDMYVISKEGVSAAVDRLLKGADPATKSKVAAIVMKPLQPAIRSALREAGGEAWDDYFTTFAKGMGDIERKELLAKAMQLYDTNPNQFQRLIEAESPDVVESILGRGKYDILKELTGELGPLESIVANMRTRNLADEKATEGAKAAGRLIAESERNVRIPNFFSAKVTLTNEVLRGLEGKISADALRILAESTRSGQAANEAMMALPPADRSKVVQFVRQYITRNPKVRGALAAARPGAVAGVATNALSPPTQNALAEQ